MGRGSCEKLNPANLMTHGMMQWGLEPEDLGSGLCSANYQVGGLEENACPFQILEFSSNLGMITPTFQLL